MKKHNENRNSNDEQLNAGAPVSHEELCAYVFGEADGELRAKVEAALQGDEALRAEHESLSATIGLVKSTCADSEQLAPEILATLEAAAKPAPQPTAWYLSAPVRMAAGIAALATGIVAGRALMQEGPQADTTELALLERKNELSRAERSEAYKLGSLPEEEAEVLGGFEVEIAQGASVADPAIKELGKIQQEPRTSRGLDSRLAGNAQSPATRSAPGTEMKESELYDSLGSLGYIGGGGGGGATTGAVADVKLRDQSVYHLEVAGEKPDGWTAGRKSTPSEGSSHGGTYKGPGDTAPPSGGGGGGSPTTKYVTPKLSSGSKPEAVAGSDDFFLGHGQADQPKDASNAPAVAERKRLKSKKSESGPASPGPSTPGPASPPARGLSSPGAAVAGVPVRQDANDSLRLDLDSFGRSTGDPAAKPDADAEVLAIDEVSLGMSFDRALDHEGDLSRGLRRQLTVEQVDELCKHRVDRILQDCRRRANERPRDMFFRYWGDNAFQLARLDNLSTFGVDVDTASYALARRYLTDGVLPEKAQIRTEEFVNYFKPDVAAPTKETFAVHTDLTPSRFGVDTASGNQRYMMRVVVRGREVPREERKPLALTFVIDTSGSMKEGGRLELVKHSLRLLCTQLDANDTISIVAFSREARLVLPATSAANRGLVEAALYGLNPDGGTNAESGLKMGYEVAKASLSTAVHNRVILLSDGVANIGQTDQDRINADVKARRDSGIFLNTIGVGMDNHNDSFLEQLANKGDGLCNYVDSAVEARRALVENFTGAFETIARDVKIQVEFDAEQVYRYRLLGYENRAIADADFRNDAVDAGEVGAGHQVVALYELELTGKASDGPMADVKLRWKAPTGAGRDPLEDSATERNYPVSAELLSTWEGASDGYKRSTLVAQFAEILRRSVHARGDSLDELISETQKLAVQMQDPDLEEFVAMLQKSRELIIRHVPQRDTLTMCIDSIRRNHILRAQYEELRQTENRVVIDELERQNQELEARIEALIRGELEQRMK